MTKPLRLALAQVNATVGDIARERPQDPLSGDKAREAGAHLVVFPEMAIPGYPPEDLLLRASFVEENLAAWRDVAGSVRGVTAVAGFADQDAKGRPYNAAGIAAGGRALGRLPGRCTFPTTSVFDEVRYFRRGKDPMVFPVGGSRVGITVCEDIWVRGGPCSGKRRREPGIILNISASPYHTPG